MKFKALISMGLASSVLLTAGSFNAASAHEQVGRLGRNKNATDVYRVTCTDQGGGGPHLEFQIRDLLPRKPPLVQVEVEKGNQKAVSTDLRDGDPRSSPLVKLNGGAGGYTVTVKKLPKPNRPDRTRRYPENYLLTYHCITGIEHTATSIVTLRNQ